MRKMKQDFEGLLQERNAEVAARPGMIVSVLGNLDENITRDLIEKILM